MKTLLWIVGGLIAFVVVMEFLKGGKKSAIVNNLPQPPEHQTIPTAAQ